MSVKRANSEKIVPENNKKIPKLDTGFWANGLISSMKDPELVIQEDELVVVIKDKFPKAKYHYLVVPIEDISNIKKVNKSHLDLLRHMHKVGKNLAKEKHDGVKFKFGYHTEASMFRLHLHVISEDMNSICLKTKRHWNSFTSAFFIKSKHVIKTLEDGQQIQFLSSTECKTLMDTPLKCHKCDYAAKHMPDLKIHIKTHFS